MWMATNVDVCVVDHGATGRSACDSLERKFRRAIGVEESVGFLIRIGKLRVAETGEQAERCDNPKQLDVPFLEFLLRLRP